MRLITHVKGFVEQVRDTTVEGIKKRLSDGLDGRPLTWLAERMDDDYKNLQRWVNGTVMPPVDFLVRYCLTMGYSADWLLLGKEPRIPVPVTDIQKAMDRIVAAIPPELIRLTPRPDDPEGR